jgi:hypothetical protein
MRGRDLFGFVVVVVAAAVGPQVRVPKSETVSPDAVTDQGEQTTQELNGVVFELDELGQHRIAKAGRRKSGDDVVPETTQQVEKGIVTWGWKQ